MEKFLLTSHLLQHGLLRQAQQSVSRMSNQEKKGILSTMLETELY
jgi:hypothetical protein